ncbi:hypothetical protein ACMA5I_07595 [Paracoccaceae bacterium GXU_MW_L88]
MKIPFASFALTTALLAGCATTLAPDTLDIDANGDNFSGMAGSDWTLDEISRELMRDVCDGDAPAVFSVTPIEGGGYSFNGRC